MKTLIDFAREAMPDDVVRGIVEALEQQADFHQTIIDLGWGGYTEDGCHFIYWGPTGDGNHIFPRRL